MPNLNREFIESQKRKLLDEKARVEAELKSVARPAAKGTDNYDAEYEEMGDDVDANAAEVYTYETNLALEHDLESILKKVNLALEKIEQGNYGQCEQGDDIEVERLKAIPWATTCINHSS